MNSMPEVIHPGVFVDEVPSRTKTIEGVSTSTAGFVGRTDIGPTESPVLVSSVAEYERHFGDSCDLWLAAKAFFGHGGKRLYVRRVAGAEDYEEGLRALERVAEIALVAAPGASM